MHAKYLIVCYKRIKGPTVPMTWRQAVYEMQCLKIAHPDNKYEIEEVKK